MADDQADGLLSQDDINAALAAAGMEGEASPPAEASSAPENSDSMGQADIDAALAEAKGADDGAGVGDGADAAPPTSAEPDARVDSAGRPFDEVAAAMAAAIESESAAAPPPPASETPAAAPATSFEIPELGPDQASAPTESQGIDLLRDVELDVKIELGRSRMLVEDVLRLGDGSVVELDKLAGDPVDVLVNNRLVARGEVLVLNDYFCVRINDIISKEFEEEALH